MNRRASSHHDDQQRRGGDRRRSAEQSAVAASHGAGLLASLNLGAGRWGVGLVAAIFVSSTVMLPSDAVGQGVGLVLHVFALIALVLWAVWCCLAPQSARWQVTWIDGLVWVMLAWMGVSAWIMAARGNPRLTLNVFWIWAVLVASYWLARQFLRTAEDCRALVALMLAVTVIESSLGLYESTYVRSRDLAAYEADKEGALRAAGIVAPEGSPLRAQFESRMRDTEPLGTFSLTNSLAGLLAPWLILACGIGLAMFQAERTATKRGAGILPTYRIQWAMFGFALLLVVICLLLTKSRSAYLATLGGFCLLVVIAARRRWRIPAWWLVAGAAGTGLLIVISTAFGLLDRLVLTEARKSLGVRWEYWQSTGLLTLDHPWFGCGLGNFQNYYSTYKLPQASETVADPHNWLFEVAANSGWPAALGLATFLIAVVGQLVIPSLLGRSTLAGRSTPADGQRESDGEPSEVPKSGQARGRAGEGSAESARAWVYVGFGAGLILAVVASLLSQFVPNPFLLFVAMPVGGAMVWCFRPWVRQGTLPSWAVGVSIVVLVVNLSAAGSMSFVGVAGTLWLLAACGLRLRELESATSEVHAESSQPTPRWAAIGGLLVAAALLIGCTVTAYRPVMLSAIEIQRGDTLAQQGDASAAETAYQAASTVDPWSPEPWQRLAGLYAQSLMRSPESEQAWRELGHAVSESIQRNQRSHVLRREMAELHLSVWRRTNDARALQRVDELLDAALRLNPNSNILHAQRAWVGYLRGESALARREAQEALRLDELNPHREQKLSEQRITDGSSRFSEQPGPPAGESAEHVMKRLVARSLRE